LATSCTFAEARATAVSAMISTMGEPSPLATDRRIKLSNTMSISSGTCAIICQFVIMKPVNYLQQVDYHGITDFREGHIKIIFFN
jgi:hypothetical protein